MNVYTNKLYRYGIMLEYNRIDIFEGIDIKKANDFHECSFCLYYYFFIMNFKFRTGVCNGCHGIMQKSMSLDDAVVVIVVTVKGND